MEHRPEYWVFWRRPRRVLVVHARGCYSCRDGAGLHGKVATRDAVETYPWWPADSYEEAWLSARALQAPLRAAAVANCSKRLMSLAPPDPAP